MHPTTILTGLAVLAISAGVRAGISAQVTIYSDDACTDNPEVLYIDVSPDYCFSGSGGNSWNDLQFENCNGYDVLSTWSGTNCEGSVARTDSATSGCNAVPFGSVELDCQDEA